MTEAPRSLNPGTRDDDDRRQPQKDATERANVRDGINRTVRDARRFGVKANETFNKKDVLKEARANEVRKIDKRPHCKARPNKSKGSGGRGKGFVPWC